MSEETKVEQQSSLYKQDLFKDDMELINEELNNLDELYNELKTHFDGVKNSQSRGSLSFIKDQTSNLISIKTTKLNYIKQRADLKKNITDFAFKERSLSVKQESSDVDTITAEIVKKLTSEFKYVSDQNDQSNNEENDIDQILDNELDDEDIGTIVENSTSIETINVDIEYRNETTPIQETIDEDIDIQTNLDENTEEIEDNTIDAVDLDTGLFYRLDKDSFEIVEELGFIEKIVDDTEIDDESYAIGESGTIYLAITLDDEDE